MTSKGKDYHSERAQLAGRIDAIFTENLKRGFAPPDLTGCLWLADVVMAIRNGARKEVQNSESRRVIDTGHRFLSALEDAQSTLLRYWDVALIAETTARIRSLLAILGSHRQPHHFLAENVRQQIAIANDGKYPRGLERNAPLVVIVGALFDLAKIEPGKASTSTVSKILKGERQKSAQ